MFTWGEKDFVADPVRIYQSAWIYNKGSQKVCDGGYKGLNWVLEGSEGSKMDFW